jgi:hypothetical protein
MRILQTSLAFLMVTSIISCTSNPPDDLFRPSWQGIKTSDLVFSMGDLISIKDSNFYYAAILLDVDSDSSGIWYGLCFTDFKNSFKPDLRSSDSLFLFGRQIPHGLINTQCIDCYDLSYINENGLMKNKANFSLIGHINYNPLKINIGSESATMELTRLISDYRWGIERRLMKPDDCKTGIFKLNAVRERFFPFSMIK